MKSIHVNTDQIYFLENEMSEIATVFYIDAVMRIWQK